MSVKNTVEELQKNFPNIENIESAKSFSDRMSKGIHLGDAGEGGTIDNEPAADYYFEGWNFGINPKLENKLNELGYHAEWYDAGTLIAYEN